jgi:hypothetical protein
MLDARTILSTMVIPDGSFGGTLRMGLWAPPQGRVTRSPFGDGHHEQDQRSQIGLDPLISLGPFQLWKSPCPLWAHRPAMPAHPAAVRADRRTTGGGSGYRQGYGRNMQLTGPPPFVKRWSPRRILIRMKARAPSDSSESPRRKRRR